MKNQSEITEEVIKVPQDLLIDVLSIILKENLKYEITQIQENRSIAVIAIGLDCNQSRQVKVFQNIQNHLHYYNDYRYGQNESINWRES
ncbi:MAG: hypothetical protein H0W84_04210 [Bacteroidetes bacterium]|nr:hypothetical protein [Bacteroidota bacterium]